ncbi:sensor histidine kinase [Megalodesulfovibrio paquesii]
MPSAAPYTIALIGRPEALERAVPALLHPHLHADAARPAQPPDLTRNLALTHALAVRGVVVDPPGESPALPPGVPQFDSPAALLAACPDLHMLLDLRESPQAFAALKAVIPPELAGQLTVGDRCTFAFLETLLGTGQLRPAWREELEQTRSVLEALFEQSDDEILLLDAQGTVLDANTKACARRGLAREALLGCNYFQLDAPATAVCHQPDEPDASAPQPLPGKPHALACPVSRALETATPQEATVPLVEPDGGLRTLRVMVYPILGPGAGAAGRLEHVLEIRRDITEMLEMHRRLQQSERLAAIGELSTYIAHEIRNPLFAIAGFANSLVRSGALDEDARQKASIILDESRRLDAILKSTLNFARPLQSADLAMASLDLNLLVRDTAELFAIKCREQGLELQLALAESLPLAKADGELIKQCVINCIKNAMEALELQRPQDRQGPGRITLRTAFSSSLVSVAVEDNGPGIAEEIRPRIFNPFFSTKNQGSGLGLAMTKKIVEEMGGEVHLATQEGQGATITLSLPAVAAQGASGVGHSSTMRTHGDES